MYLQILGSGQDAGIPQIGCLCSNCSHALEDSNNKRLTSSIVIYSDNNEVFFFIDASPDIKFQFFQIQKIMEKQNSFQKKNFPPIFLTHTHFGHLAGLWMLGKECMDAREVEVYCSPKVKKFLESNHPFKHLISRGNILPIELPIGESISFSDCLIESFEVPHRNEYADTVGYQITNNKKIIYLPDLDFWTEELIEKISRVDIALIDGTFYSHTEIPGYSQVPHPPILETMELFSDIKTEIIFTHLNHSNPIIDKKSKERKEATEKGFKIAYDGLQFQF